MESYWWTNWACSTPKAALNPGLTGKVRISTSRGTSRTGWNTDGWSDGPWCLESVWRKCWKVLNLYMWDMVFPRTFSCILVIVFVIVLEPPTLHPFWWPNGLKHLLQHILKNDSHGCCWLVGLTSTELESMHVHATTYPYGSANVYPCPSDAQGAKKKSLLNACITRKPWHETLLLKGMHLKSITGFDSCLLQELKAFKFPMLLFSCTVLHVLHECYLVLKLFIVLQWISHGLRKRDHCFHSSS